MTRRSRREPVGVPGSRSRPGWRPCLAALAFGLAVAVSVAGIFPAPVNAADAPFESEIRAFEAADAAGPPPPDPILFVGSSTIVRWTNLGADFGGFTVLNRGFGGSTLADVLRFFDRVVVPYAPSLVVLYEGDNDLAAGQTVEEIFSRWRVFAQRMETELPGTGVLFVSVKPSPSRVSLLEAQRELNRRVAADCAGRPRFGFVDVAGPMLDAAGQPRGELFVSDRLHLNPAGYALWRGILAPELEAWAAAHPERSVRAPLNALLIDFGGPDLLSGQGAGGTARHWNNLPAAVGASSQGRFSNLVTAEGTPTSAAWVMTSRFNGANQNGTTAPAPYPDSATRDSLFGNTETFSGLANVTPAFRITGLRSGVAHDLTFYASRMGVSDNRETRYTVTGASVASADLNVANNVLEVARVTGIEPDSGGALAIELSPGPHNNNANHFVYLGVLQVAEAAPGGRVFLVDLGASDSPTGTMGASASRWNDVPAGVGTDPAGVVAGLWAIDGTATGIGVRIVSPFAAVNGEGTAESRVFPPAATKDSLLGAPAPPGGAAGSRAALRLTDLDEGHAYSLAFYASRIGITGRRETRYVVLGADGGSSVLEPVGNVNRMAWVTGIRPDAARGITVALEPGPASDGADPSPSLGVLRLEWRRAEVPPRPTLSVVGVAEGKLRLRVDTGGGRSCLVQQSPDLVKWIAVESLAPPAGGTEIEAGIPGGRAFFRVVDAP